jgi:hypothetical protein
MIPVEHDVLHRRANGAALGNRVDGGKALAHTDLLRSKRNKGAAGAAPDFDCPVWDCCAWDCCVRACCTRDCWAWAGDLAVTE